MNLETILSTIEQGGTLPEQIQFEVFDSQLTTNLAMNARSALRSLGYSEQSDRHEPTRTQRFFFHKPSIVILKEGERIVPIGRNAPSPFYSNDEEQRLARAAYDRTRALAETPPPPAPSPPPPALPLFTPKPRRISA